MRGAARASANAVHVLVALGRVLGKVDPGAEHAPDVGVPLVKSLVDDGVDEGGAWRGEGARLVVTPQVIYFACNCDVAFIQT